MNMPAFSYPSTADAAAPLAPKLDVVEEPVGAQLLSAQEAALVTAGLVALRAERYGAWWCARYAGLDDLDQAAYELPDIDVLLAKLASGTRIVVGCAR